MIKLNYDSPNAYHVPGIVLRAVNIAFPLILIIILRGEVSVNNSILQMKKLRHNDINEHVED